MIYLFLKYNMVAYTSIYSSSFCEKIASLIQLRFDPYGCTRFSRLFFFHEYLSSKIFFLPKFRLLLAIWQKLVLTLIPFVKSSNQIEIYCCNTTKIDVDIVTHPNHLCIGVNVKSKLF